MLQHNSTDPYTVPHIGYSFHEYYCIKSVSRFYIFREKSDQPAANNTKDSLNDKSKMEVEGDDDDDEIVFLDNSPLFFQPGKTGFYSPRCGRISEERLSCYRNVGR